MATFAIKYNHNRNEMAVILKVKELLLGGLGILTGLMTTTGLMLMAGVTLTMTMAV